MSNKLLDAVRNAERIRSTAYDQELQIYINSALYDMKRLKIVFNEEEPEDEVIATLTGRYGVYNSYMTVVFVKWE